MFLQCVFLNVYPSVTMCKCTTKRYKPFSCSLIMFVLFCLIMVFKIGYVCVYVYVYVYVSVCVYVCVNECVYVWMYVCECVRLCISVCVSAGCGWWLGSLLERKALWWTSLDPLGRYRPTFLFSIYGSLWKRALSLLAVALPSPRDLLVHQGDTRPLRRCSLFLTLSLRHSHTDTDTRKHTPSCKQKVSLRR